MSIYVYLGFLWIRSQLSFSLCRVTCVFDAMATVQPRLLKSLQRLQCSIFQTSFNPASRRNGAKFLRPRLRGPSMVEYYPPREEMSIGKLNKVYPGWNLVDVDEVRRNISVQEHKDRGKGAPKKSQKKGTLILPLPCTTSLLTCFPGESRRTQKKR